MADRQEGGPSQVIDPIRVAGDLVEGVGGDEHRVAAIRDQGHHGGVAGRVTGARVQGARLADGRQQPVGVRVEGRIGREIDPVAPGPLRRPAAEVGHLPRELQHSADHGRRREQDLAHGQVGRRRQADRHRLRRRPAVVPLPEDFIDLVRPIGLDQNVIAPLDPVRDGDRHPPDVAGPGIQARQRVDRGQDDVVAVAVDLVGREHHAVVPDPRLRDPLPLIGRGPLQGHGGPAHRGGEGADCADHQVGRRRAPATSKWAERPVLLSSRGYSKTCLRASVTTPT